MDRPTSTIVGRDRELHEISAFLDRVETGPGALVIEGSAGIGKTTLWAAGVRAARDRGYVVVTAHAAESEARLSYAALGDLLVSVSADAFAGMPRPLRQAVDVALLRTDGRGAAPDQLAVSLATAHALRSLASRAPLILAIDDLQWLDRPSARVLSFALRRLGVEAIGALVSVRIAADSPGDLLELDRAVPGTRHLAVGPLGQEPFGRILRDQTGAEVPHPVVTRLHRVTGGNPLFALEMARAVVRDGTGALPGDLWTVPEDLQRLLSARLAAVPQAARAPLLAIAATSQPTWDLVLEIAGHEERTVDALGRAEQAGIIERSGGRVRFTHPLLGSTLYLNASTTERRALHGRLASLTTEVEERARHLALATEGPAEAVAATLETASQRARARGAPDAAAELAALACELTAAGDAAGLRRRRLAAAAYFFDGGDVRSARRLLMETIATSSPGHERAEMLYMLASMSWMDLINGVRTPCLQALAEAGDDPRLLTGLHSDLAWAAFYLGDLGEANDRARESVAWASRHVGAAARADALASLAFTRFLRGEADDAMLAEAIHLQDDALTEASWTTASIFTTPRTVLGLQLMWSYRLDEARAVFEQELAEFERHAMYTVRLEVLGYLSELECRAGNGSRAAAHGAEARDIFEESGQLPTQIHVVLFNQAWAAALLGRVDEARQLATEGLRLATATDDRFNAAWSGFVLGYIDVALADYDGAVRHLEPAMWYVEDLGASVAGVMPCVPDQVEADVALGRIAEAEALIARLERQAGGPGGGWAMATALRGRALVAAAQGDLLGAADAAARSTAQLGDLGLAFEAARSRLVLGQIHRRSKRKRLAREHLEGARDAFDQVGAVLWADRARSELGRVGGRPSSPFELTDSEQRVAALVAKGRTNQETADALFVSPSTVQASLKRIYHKLGVRSRTELAAKVGQSLEP
jgi:DNA-binding CsgD family transcriptional regulator